MERYEKYKDSGVEWIGEIPNDWEVTKISSISACITGFAFKSEQFSFDEGVKLVRGDNVTEGNLRWGEKTRLWKEVTPDLEKFYLAENDIVIGMDGSKVGKNYALVQKDELPLLLVQRVARIRSKNASFAKWIEFAISSYDFKYYVNASKTDPAIPHITLKDIYDYKIFLPPSDRIDSIVQILSNKLSELDTLITKKEKLIELLKEERTAIINQAVTKGLDPNVEMRDSGVEWLGEIPAHWEVKRLKHVNVKVGSGVTPKGGAEVYQESGIPLLRSQNVYFDGFRLDDVAFISEEIHDSMSNSKVLANDVLINITGGSIGRCYYVSNEFSDANVNQHVCIIRPNEKILTIYLYNFLRSDLGQLQVDLCQTGGNREALNFEQLKKFVIPLPDLSEQNQIIEFVIDKQKEIDNIISKTDQEITLLKEYKTALINEVVTGKVKVT